MAPTSLREGRRRLRRLRGSAAIPLADAPSFEPVRRRTRRIRVALGALLIAGGLAAFLAAPTEPGRRFLPSRTAGVVVLDMSSSIQPGTYYRIDHALASLAATRQRFGLVLFSDVAYEALPPGTPASALAPLVRFFSLPAHTAPGVPPTFPVNPWSASFTGGTRISAGLELARSLVNGYHLRRSAVVLISDLADDPEDRDLLNQAVAAYLQQRIPLRVVPLNAAPGDAAFFARVTRTALSQAPSPAEGSAPSVLANAAARGAFPVVLVVLVVMVACLLAAAELWSARLRLGASEETT